MHEPLFMAPVTAQVLAERSKEYGTKGWSWLKGAYVSAASHVEHMAQEQGYKVDLGKHLPGFCRCSWCIIWIFSSLSMYPQQAAQRMASELLGWWSGMAALPCGCFAFWIRRLTALEWARYQRVSLCAQSSANACHWVLWLLRPLLVQPVWSKRVKWVSTDEQRLRCWPNSLLWTIYIMKFCTSRIGLWYELGW